MPSLAAEGSASATSRQPEPKASMFSSDVIVIGGGLVGTAVAYGLSQLGKTITVLDEGDDVFRASRGNFGLIWVHGKGRGAPRYARWTRESARQWPTLAAQLQG